MRIEKCPAQSQSRKPVQRGGKETMNAALVLVASESLRQAACFLGGYFLRKTEAFSPLDGLAAHRLLLTLVLPILLIGLKVNSGSFLDPTIQPLVLVNLIHLLILWLTSYVALRSLPVKDRGIGTALVTCISCCFSGLLYHGIRESAARAKAVVLSDLPVSVLSLALAGTGLIRTRRRLQGGAMPGKYRHADGGVYSGEWKGFSKHGFGSYTYPSGSIYSGEWKENVKEGFGTYRYATGGAYLGEWKKGNPSGMGIRVYKSGNTAHGNFVDGKLESALPADVCEASIERSMRAAKNAALVAKERNQTIYQKVVTELIGLLPIILVILVHKLPQIFYALASEGTTRVIMLFLAPLSALAFGLQSAFGPGLSDSTLLDISGVLAFRYAVSCQFAALVLALMPSMSIHSNYSILISCLLCPVSPLLVLFTQKYTRETKNFVRAVVGWSMIFSLALTTSTQILCETSGRYAASAFSFGTSFVLLFAYAKGRKKLSQISPVMSCGSLVMAAARASRRNEQMKRSPVQEYRSVFRRKRYFNGSSSFNTIQRPRGRPRTHILTGKYSRRVYNRSRIYI